MLLASPALANSRRKQIAEFEAVRRALCHAAQDYEAIVPAQVLGTVKQGLAGDDLPGGVFHEC